MGRVASAAFLIVFLVLVGVFSRQAWQSRARAASVSPSTAASVPAAVHSGQARDPGVVLDPIASNRPMRRDAAPRTSPPDWVKARPAFQTSRSAAERGGVEPCAQQPVDTSPFEAWAPLSKGRYALPKANAFDASGNFELLIHLHGDEVALRELSESRQRFVLVAITLGVDQSYAPLLSGPQALKGLVAEVEQTLSQRTGKRAHAAHVTLSAWSAGFVGVEAALAQPGGRDVDAVILIDGLHAPRGDRSAFEAQLKPFVDYAGRAVTGERFFFVSHSSIDPPDFASTTECAHYLIASQGGKPSAVRRDDPLGLELVESFSRGDFYVRGYAGNAKADHCAQLAVLRDAYAAVGRRFFGAK